MYEKNLTIDQIIKAFPNECRELIPKVNRMLKKELKPYHIKCKSIRYRHYDQFKEYFWLEVAKVFFNPERIEKRIKHNNMILRSLDGNKEGRINDHMIQQAKEVPIAILYDFASIRSGNARFQASCPFHTDSTPSFTVYPNNSFYCFSCLFGGDVISFIRKLHGFGFIDAVKYLLTNK